MHLIQTESLPVKKTRRHITDHWADCYPAISKFPQFATPVCYKFNVVTDVLHYFLFLPFDCIESYIEYCDTFTFQMLFLHVLM